MFHWSSSAGVCCVRASGKSVQVCLKITKTQVKKHESELKVTYSVTNVCQNQDEW